MNSLIKLIVDDSSYNAKIKNAASAFMNFASQIGGAKGQFGALTKAIQQSTVAQEALNAVMAKNPMGAVMSIATAAATKLVEKLTSVSEEQQKLAEAAEERAERERHENETVVNSAAKVLTEYELLRQKWATLSDEHAKSEWIKENQRKFKQLGMAVSDVKTAEDVFVNNTQAVCNALIARAKAEAYGELYKEQLKKKISNELNPTVDNGRLYVKQNRFKRDENAERMAGVTAEDMNLKTETYYKNGVVSSDTKFESYKQSGLDKLNAYRLKMARARKAEDDRNLEMLALGMSTNQQEYETGMRGLGIWDNSGGNNGGKGGGGVFLNQDRGDAFVVKKSLDRIILVRTHGGKKGDLCAISCGGNRLVKALSAGLKMDIGGLYRFATRVKFIHGKKDRVSNDADDSHFVHRCFTLPRYRFSSTTLCSRPPSAFPLM
jgi:DNA-binding ferritin-like protein (Dps family)